MFQGWRLQLREADASFRQGQLDEASRLLLQGKLSQYLPGKRLSAKVAAGLAERAQSHAIQGDMDAAWRDVKSARMLVGMTDQLLRVRRDIVASGLSLADGYIESGDPDRALVLLDSIQRHDVHDEPLRIAKRVARHLKSARNLGRRGKFVEAESQAKAAVALRANSREAVRVHQELHHATAMYRELVSQLYHAMSQSCWTKAVALAEQILEMAPDCRLARDSRRLAWAKVGTRLTDSRHLGATHVSSRVGCSGQSQGSDLDVASGVAVAQLSTGRRFLLWVDGVGGYLVCLGDDILLGQAVPCNQVDVPILGDLSRQHARVSRRGDGYVISPLQRTRINGRPVSEETLLSDGDEIELARAVHIRFRQPHALSASARLDFTSSHRTQPTADGVLLMAESCVLGPSWENHVVCRHWQSDVVLYRRDNTLCCRTMDSMEVDGRLCDGKSPLGLNSRVAGSDFSLSLEDLS